MVIFLIILYIVIAAASIFGLMVANNRYEVLDDWAGNAPWVLCGIFWPVALLPAIAYIAAYGALRKRARETSQKTGGRAECRTRLTN